MRDSEAKNKIAVWRILYTNLYLPQFNRIQPGEEPLWQIALSKCLDDIQLHRSWEGTRAHRLLKKAKYLMMEWGKHQYVEIDRILFDIEQVI